MPRPNPGVNRDFIPHGTVPGNYAFPGGRRETGWIMDRIFKANLPAGLLMLLFFLWSGYYLQTEFRPDHLENLTARMEIRANHIYMLMIALLNLFFSFLPRENFRGTSAVLLRMVSALLLLAALLAIPAFFTEHSGTLQGRKFTFYAVLSCFAAGLLLLPVRFLNRDRQRD